MLVQNSQTIHRLNVPAVIRCLAIGNIHGSSFIALGTHDCKLYLYDTSWQIRQELTFPQWVRSIAIGDLTGDGNDEIVLGCGDRTLRYLKWHADRYEEVAQYTFENFVDSVAIADVNSDGTREVIVGSWDQTVSVFQLIDGCFSVVWQIKIENSAGIHTVYPADVNWDEKLEILVLLKGGGSRLLKGETGETLWTFPTDQDLLACTVGFFDASGYPAVLMAGEQGIVFILNHLGEKVWELPVGQRVTALAIGDIDGDFVNELILGIGDQALEVYESPNLQISSLQLKWQRHIGSVITSIIIEDVNQDGIPEILYGGYDNRLCIVQDCFFGKKPLQSIKTPPYFPVPVLLEDSLVTSAQIRSSALFCADNEATRAPGVAESKTESVLSSPATASLSTERSSVKTSRRRVSTTAETTEAISTRESRKPRISREVSPVVLNSLDEVATIFRVHPYFPTKEEMVSTLRNAGIPEMDILPSIEFYKSKMQLSYSKSTPRGYHFVTIEAGGSREILPVPIKEISREISSTAPSSKISVSSFSPVVSSRVSFESYDVTLLFREVTIYPLKETILQAIQTIFSLSDAGTANALFDYFKTASLIQYSRNTPRGYSLTTSVTQIQSTTPAPISSEKSEVVSISTTLPISLPSASTSSTSFLSPETEVKIRDLFHQTPLFPLKADLIHAIEQIYPITEQLPSESLFNLCKLQHIIQYSSKSPRGYSLV